MSAYTISTRAGPFVRYLAWFRILVDTRPYVVPRQSVAAVRQA
jgi:hypothetical protein